MNSKINNPKLFWTLVGGLLSLGSPLGLWILLTVFPHHMTDSLLVYLYCGVGTFIAFSAFGFWAGTVLKKSHYLASHDLLTGLYNRGYMQTRLEEAYSYSQRYGNELLLCMLDLDFFKKVNDNYGHTVGDQVLKAVSKVFKNTCRKSDIVSRWGGEEFIIYFPQTDLKQGVILAERIRNNVESLTAATLGFSGKQTISIGVLSVKSSNQLELSHILNELDKSLYDSKQSGRNNVKSKEI